MVHVVEHYQQGGLLLRFFFLQSKMGKNLFFCMKKQSLQTTPIVSQLKQQFKITHPFHPEYLKKFKLVNYVNSFGVVRIAYYKNDTDITSIPLSWTDAKEADPFIELSGGRSFFKIEELLLIVKLVKDLNLDT